MTRKQDTPGRYSKATKFNESGYQVQSRKDEFNTYMRSFSRTKAKLHMVDYNSVYYYVQGNTGLYVANTAGALLTNFANAWDKVWEYGHTKGNMKDLVGGQETALGLITGNMMQIVYDLMAQNIYRSYMPVITESDDSSYWTQTTFDNFVNQLEGTPMPTFVANFVKQFAFIIKLADPYELHSVTVPGTYFQPFIGRTSYNYSSHEQARKLIVQANLANGIAQAEKYGIPMTKFSASMIEFKEITDEDPLARAVFNHYQYKFYTNEQVTLSPAGRMGTQSTGDDVALNMTTDYTNRKYFFPGNGPDTIIDAFAPLLSTYDATNNLNGGWFINDNAGAVASKVSFKHASHYATSLTDGTKATLNWFLLMFLASWNGIAITDGTPPSFVLNIDTDFGASIVSLGGETSWQYANYHDLFYGTGITYAQSLEFLISNLVKLTYGK